MAGRKKTEHLKRGEPKTAQVSTNLTPTGKQGLEDLADSLGLSVGELLEQLGRGEISLDAQAGKPLPN